ncbi:MAG: redoxin family protein [Marivibrio sp.]|uniref:redoxin family protein n=1 Tax=Marivibrio sp. TaxID=2039719 RepID=UPI0032ECCAF3
MIKKDDPVPPGPLMQFSGGAVHTLDSRDLFGVGRHIIVGVVGAFTPICGVTHLPEYVRLFETLMDFGNTDSISSVCVADPFVVSAWGKAMGCDGKIAMYADPVGAFTDQCGLAANYDSIGMGNRSQRYILIFRGGVVERLTVEPDPFQVDETSAARMIASST